MRKSYNSKEQFPATLKGIKSLDRVNSRGVSPTPKQVKSGTPLRKGRYITPGPLSPKGSKNIKDGILIN